MRISFLRAQKGYLLIEVLLTVVLISVSLTILIGGLLSGYKVTLLNSDYFQAMVLLENQMSYWRAQGFTDMKVHGDLTAKWSEKFQIKVVSGPMSGVGGQTLRNLDVVLSWQSGSKSIKLPITTFYPAYTKQ